MRMNTESSLRREFIISSHFLTSCLWSTSTRIEAQPELSTRQQQHRQSSRCPASVILQDCKTERTYKYNRTVTAQQYRYSSIVQFSSISTVYSSTIHPRTNSPTLNPYSTIGVKSNLMSAIGISASETKASYRLLCLALKRNSVTMTDTRPLSRRRQVLWEPY